MWKLHELADTVELVVSELAANGVNASTGPDGHPVYWDDRMPVIQVGLYLNGAVLLARVWDQADGTPIHKAADDSDENGRGLDMVDMLTGSRWGWHPLPTRPGKCVWAEFPVASAENPQNH